MCFWPGFSLSVARFLILLLVAFCFVLAFVYGLVVLFHSGILRPAPFRFREPLRIASFRNRIRQKLCSFAI